jgi:hypothetical protein
MGDSEFVITPSPFQIMRPEAMTEAKLRTWRRTWYKIGFGSLEIE